MFTHMLCIVYIASVMLLEKVEESKEMAVSMLSEVEQGKKKAVACHVC